MGVPTDHASTEASLTALALVALDLATPEERAAVAAVGPAVDQLRAALARLADGVPAVAAPPRVRARLQTAVGLGRFERFATRVAALYDVPLARAREILGWIDATSPWLPATPGLALVHFRGGPAAVDADCGLIRVDPGGRFPWHAHRGDEHTLFLAGVGRDQAGATYGAGDELTMAPGTAHDFVTISDDALVVAVRHRGVVFGAPPPAA
ncbi:MAG: cupin domain-containing protein [Kofleriaceae bacterium]